MDKPQSAKKTSEKCRCTNNVDWYWGETFGRRLDSNSWIWKPLNFTRFKDVKRYLQSLGKQCLKFRDNLLGHDWVLNFLQRHTNLLLKRSCHNIKRSRAEKSEDEIEAYFDNLRRSIENIPASNILNFDETNLSDDPGSQKCLFRCGIKYPERVMNTSKTSLSVMIAISGSGSVLLPYTVYKAERLYNQWTKERAI